MKTTRHIQSQHGDGWEYTFENGTKLYTIEYGNTSTIDFYENVLQWEQALKDGYPNDGRIEFMTNCFFTDGNETTFFVFCAIYAACGDIKKTFDAAYEVFRMDYEGKLHYRRPLGPTLEDTFV